MNRCSELLPGTLVNNRFSVLHKITQTEKSFLYAVKDLTNGENMRVMKVRRKDVFTDVYHNEIEFLGVCKGIRGFPYMIDAFPMQQESGFYDCFVISHEGEDLQKHVNRKNSMLSIANTVRLGYQMFNLVEKMHNMGYLHRDCGGQNFMIDSNWQGELKVKLIDFGFTKKIDPPPHCYNMISWYGSLNVVKNGDSTIFDDYISLVCNLMFCRNINAFGNDINEYVRMKELFHENPMSHFRNNDTKWIGLLYVEIERQRGSGYHKDNIMKIFQDAVVGVLPQSPITFTYVDGTIYID